MMMLTDFTQRPRRVALLLAPAIVHYFCCVSSAFSPPSSSLCAARHPGVAAGAEGAVGSESLQSDAILLAPRWASSSLPPLPSSPHPDTERYENAPHRKGLPADVQGMKLLGEEIIMKAALKAGATERMVDVEWKADRIVVTVDMNRDGDYQAPLDDPPGLAWMGNSPDEARLDRTDWKVDEGKGCNGLFVALEEGNGDYNEQGEQFTEEKFGPISEPGVVDLGLVARTINELLAEGGEESPGFAIAKLHKIEVTTPEFDNVLKGKLMFESYKGFDVIVEHWEEPKKSKAKKGNKKEDIEEEAVAELKLKVTEGKLVGRDYDREVTIINVKGRVAKIKNDKIECVKLPKAKREKGVK